MRRCALALCFLLGSPAAGTPDEGPSLVRAVTRYYADGPAAALVVLEAPDLVGSSDAAWWRARCWLDLDAPGRALDAIATAGASWRNRALEAEARLLMEDWEGARHAAEVAAGVPRPEGAPGWEVEWRRSAWIAAILALREGDTDTAGQHLRRLAARDPALDLPPLLAARLPEAFTVMAPRIEGGFSGEGTLRYRAWDRAWCLDLASGLARACEVPTRTRGVRLDEVPFRDGTAWSAASEPLAETGTEPGIFLLSGKTATPVRLTRPPAGSIDGSPAPGRDGTLWFVRVRAESGTLFRLDAAGGLARFAPDLDRVSRVAVRGDRVVIAAVVDGRLALRFLPLPIDPGKPSVALFPEGPEAWDPSWETR